MIYKTAVYRARAPDARFRSAKESGFFYEEISKNLCLAAKAAERMNLWDFLIQQSEYYRHLLSHLVQVLEFGELSTFWKDMGTTIVRHVHK